METEGRGAPPVGPSSAVAELIPATAESERKPDAAIVRARALDPPDLELCPTRARPQRGRNVLRLRLSRSRPSVRADPVA
jgi:hypothetical protein